MTVAVSSSDPVPTVPAATVIVLENAKLPLAAPVPDGVIVLVQVTLPVVLVPST